MAIPAISETGQAALAATAPISPFLAARKLNSLGLFDRQFAVVRDPQTERFVVEVVEKSTGTVLDQFPAENALRLLALFGSGDGNQQSAAGQVASQSRASQAGANQPGANEPGANQPVQTSRLQTSRLQTRQQRTRPDSFPRPGDVI